jgi:hypothetical protein
VLGDVLVEHLVVELPGVALSQLVVYLATVGLNDVALAWRGTVSQRVVASLDVVLHHLLVLEGGVLLLDQSLGGGLVLLIVRASLQGVVLRDENDALVLPHLSVVHHLLEQCVELILYVIGPLG